MGGGRGAYQGGQSPSIACGRCGRQSGVAVLHQTPTKSQNSQRLTLTLTSIDGGGKRKKQGHIPGRGRRRLGSWGDIDLGEGVWKGAASIWGPGAAGGRLPSLRSVALSLALGRPREKTQRSEPARPLEGKGRGSQVISRPHADCVRVFQSDLSCHAG
jgi:hypothetical protein